MICDEEADEGDDEVACEHVLRVGDDGSAACIIIFREENLFFEPWTNEFFKCRLKQVKWKTTSLTLWSQLAFLNEKSKRE